ncbi:hypothetical protein [Amycolatopsis sp. CA-230715]|uniref:hypothetical protein n=1 Tax=Amycolatopsis sp. CA-230715 TaxID=2745196 RepID=UPI001C018F63|nr:hypothetical protein [Amycolatopsis sp. CA-230715]QWF83475.1 hypothetical protein HUW46_06916 [Amycolatopsis sp. CA-230715]
MPEQSGQSRFRWLLTPLVAALVTVAGAIALFKVQADHTLWLASCNSTLFIGCGLASVFFCAAAVVIAFGIGAGIARRRVTVSVTRAIVRGLLVAAGCLLGLFGFTVAAAGVLA